MKPELQVAQLLSRTKVSTKARTQRHVSFARLGKYAMRCITCNAQQKLELTIPMCFFQLGL